MPSWRAIEEAEPEFAGRVRALFDAGRHKTIATLRADGSPRISGIECEFADGELRFGSMTDARKGADEPEGELFTADITEVVVTGLDPGATKLVIEWWTPAGGLRRIERE